MRHPGVQAQLLRTTKGSVHSLHGMQHGSNSKQPLECTALCYQ